MEHAVGSVTMRIPFTAGSLTLAAAFLAGCNGGTFPSEMPPAARLAPASSMRADLRSSWISPEIAHSSQLLFESDIGMSEVDVYSLPDLKLEARLSGFKEPTGECSDARGNVWIANTYKDEMFEYSHVAKRIATIENAGPNPQGCAVDSRTGELAVLQFSAAGYTGPGEVWVYSKPSAKPRILRNRDMLYYEYGVYDSADRLWVDGLGTFGPILSKCGPSRCTTMVLHGGSIFSIASLVWDSANSTLVAFDSYCHDGPNLCSYPVSEHGTIGSPTLYLSYASKEFCTVAQTALTTVGKRSYVVGGDSEYSCSGYKNSTVDVWSYPAGGPARLYRHHVVYPYGAAVSR